MVSFQRPSWSPFVCSDSFNQSPYVQSEAYGTYNRLSDAGSVGSCQVPKVQTLDFSKLCPFEVVTDQFQTLGIQFEGAIALQPSNPIFWTHRRESVLMPLAGRQSIRLLFQAPINQLCLLVIGVREVKMIATGNDRPPLIQRSSQPNRTFSQPNDLFDPLTPHRLELDGVPATEVSLESSHPFVLSTAWFGFI